MYLYFERSEKLTNNLRNFLKANGLSKNKKMAHVLD